MKRIHRRAFLFAEAAGAFCLANGCGLPVKLSAGRVPRVVLFELDNVSVESADQWRARLRGEGLIDGSDFTLEHSRVARANLESVALGIAAQPVDVVLTSGQEVNRVAVSAIQSIPIVFNVSTDPVREGLVESLAEPGKNVTGQISISPQLMGKWLQIIREILPQVQRVALLRHAVLREVDSYWIAEAEAAAGPLNLTLTTLLTNASDDWDAVFESLTSERAQALIIVPHQEVRTARLEIMQRALPMRLPVLSEWRDVAESGALIGYGPSIEARSQRSAAQVARILPGAKPADIPVEAPNVFDFVINLKTAQALAITIPPSVLAQATEVIQ